MHIDKPVDGPGQELRPCRKCQGDAIGSWFWLEHAGEEGPTSDGSGVHWWEAWDKTGRFAARKRKRAEDRPLHEEEQAWREQLTLQSLQVLYSSILQAEIWCMLCK